MKIPKIFYVIIPAVITLAAIATDAPIWIQEDTEEFAAAADVNNDGSIDLIVVDRASGMVRVGHPSKAGLYWDDAGTSGIVPVDGAAFGRFLHSSRYSVALSGITANRIGIMDLNSAPALRDVFSLFPYQLGPNQLAGFDAVSDAGDEIFCLARLPGDDTTYIKVNTSLPSGGFHTVDSTATSSEYEFCAAVQPENGGTPIAAAFNGAVNRLQLFGTNTHSATAGDYYQDSWIKSDSRFVFGHYLSGATIGQFLVYTPQSSQALILPLKEDGAGGYEFDDAIVDTVVLPAGYATLNPGPDTGEITVITDTGEIKVVSFDGTTFTTVTDIPIPSGSTGTAAVALPGAAALYTLFDSNGDGISDSSGGFIKSSGSYVSNFPTTQLSALNSEGQISNILFFDGEPLVDTNISRVAAYRVNSWTVENRSFPAPTLDEVKALTDAGPSSGLGSPAVSSVNNLPVTATDQMVNQLTTDCSASALFSAVGESFSEVVFSPAGGSFAQSVQVTLEAPSLMNRIIYKIGGADWENYNTPFWIFEDASVTALAYNSSTGKTTPIKSVSFSFTKSPEEMDSDNDGVPDFVEIENGLDPDDGSDSDDDGLSDLDELVDGTEPDDDDSDNDGWTDRQERMAGTDPNNPSEYPADDEDLYNALLTAGEKQALFDLRVSPRPIEGTIPMMTRCMTGVTCRAYSFSGALLGVDISKNNSFPGVNNASVEFEGLSTPMQSGLFALSTPSHFNVITPNDDKSVGRELLALSEPPVLSEVEPVYTWGGGDTHTESLLWIAAAQSAYGAASREIRTRQMEYTDTTAALLFEALAARELFLRGDTATNQISLFPHRNEHEDLPHPGDKLIASLASQGPEDESAYIPAEAHEWFVDMLSTSQVSSVVQLVNMSYDIYKTCSAEANDNPGLYPLPVDAIRSLIHNDTLTGGYTNHFNASAISLAAEGADYLLGNIPARPKVSITLPALNLGGDNFTILYHPSTDTLYNLVNSENDPFPMDFAFALPSNATVQVYGFLNSDAGASGADREIEVIEMVVTALPALTPEDQDPNLLPDSYELLTFGASGAAPSRDSDGDGFSDLQEYLEGTDPTSAQSIPATTEEEIGIPTVVIDSTTGNVEVSLDWPARYQDAFHFQLESTDDLATPFTDHPTASMSGNGDRVLVNLLQSTEGTKRFYRVRVSLR